MMVFKVSVYSERLQDRKIHYIFLAPMFGDEVLLHPLKSNLEKIMLYSRC